MLYVILSTGSTTSTKKFYLISNFATNHTAVQIVEDKSSFWHQKQMKGLKQRCGRSAECFLFHFRKNTYGLNTSALLIFFQHRQIGIFKHLSSCTEELEPLQTHQWKAVMFKTGPSMQCKTKWGNKKMHECYNLEHFSYLSSSFLELQFLGEAQAHVFSVNF